MKCELLSLLQVGRLLVSGSSASKTIQNMGFQRATLQSMLEKRKKKRFVIPVSYLNKPSFQDLLIQVEEEFGYI
ncbi:hypothetical protein MANES_04G079501v8 [Manihot esculenta]|uniref:Uncharacterized protein n=1 Tax=Manihot esculenta TaxID=3983 RepID=A0ACB7HV24_MANES|nr:hypothetical protein MANES_04G079501v8 [Manihot esculenta]